ncbi:MAG: hypothetical protein ACOYNS_12700, partial [Bacteroidota bacterium]
MTTTANAGTMELRDSYGRNLQSGLLTAGLVHTLIVAALMMGPADEVKIIDTTIRDPFQWKNTISFQQFTFTPSSHPKLAVNTAGVGIPIPIPEADIDPERTIP